MSSVLDHYETFLVQNVSTISTVESTLRSLTWFLPGRFKDAELASEALSASLNVTSLYHDTVLTKVSRDDPRYKPLLPSSQHTRYTRAWADKSAPYKWAARMLEVIRFTELFIEMGLRRKTSSRTKWRGIVFLEVIKAILRLLMLRVTRRPLVAPPVPEREFDVNSLPPPSTATSPTLAPTSPSSSPPGTPDHLRNNRAPLPPHPLLLPGPSAQAISPVDDFLLPKALTTSAVRGPLSLIKTLSSPLHWASEVMYVLRPLVYALLLSSNRTSGRPLTSLVVMELLSRNLRRTPTPLSSLERTEYARRDRDMLWYLLRGSIWQSYTRPKVEGFVDKLASLPLLGIASALVKDWVPLINDYYYYSAP